MTAVLHPKPQEVIIEPLPPLDFAASLLNSSAKGSRLPGICSIAALQMPLLSNAFTAPDLSLAQMASSLGVASVLYDRSDQFSVLDDSGAKGFYRSHFVPRLEVSVAHSIATSSCTAWCLDTADEVPQHTIQPAEAVLMQVPAMPPHPPDCAEVLDGLLTLCGPAQVQEHALCRISAMKPVFN